MVTESSAPERGDVSVPAFRVVLTASNNSRLQPQSGAVAGPQLRLKLASKTDRSRSGGLEPLATRGSTSQEREWS
jgi:hypothetical protein